MTLICAEGAAVAYPLFQTEGGGSIPTSALQLHIEPISFEDAKRLNRRWHSRLPLIKNPASIMDQYPCYAAIHDDMIYAVAIWPNPVARLLPQRTWLELRRMAVSPPAPKNTASRMLAIMAKLIQKTRPAVVRLVSYQDTEVHTGCIYKAAGWQLVIPADPRSRPWNNAARERNEEQTTSPKHRWEKLLSA